MMSFNSSSMIALELNKPIAILVPDSEEKTNFRKNKEFNKKLDKLDDLLENADIPNTTETNEAIDKLITILSKYPGEY